MNLYDSEQSLIWQGKFRSREKISSSLSVVCFDPEPGEKELLFDALLRVEYLRYGTEVNATGNLGIRVCAGDSQCNGD